MSVTVNDILKLPCLNEAKVIAGKRGLTKILSSITVLEFSDPNDLQNEILSNMDFYGGEMVITAFANIPNNVEQQCANIRRLASVGEVGMILYYVGIFMPKVDQELIKLANELDFVLIVMPEKRHDLRYSEVISEVMEAIIKDQNAGTSLLADALGQMSRLPSDQRTVDAALRIARNQSRTSLVLMDGYGRALGQANWPMSLELDPSDYVGIEMMVPVSLSDNRTVWRCPLNQSDPQSMELYLIKDGNGISRELVFQIVEFIRLAVSLWSSSHAEMQMSELIRAIICDEPLKMRRLAELFHINIASIHSMWVLRVENLDESQKQKNIMGTLAQLRDILGHRCDTSIADTFEGYIVGFMTWREKDEDVVNLSNELIMGLKDVGISATLVRCHNLIETKDVRRAFLRIKESLDSAKRIWPRKQTYSLEELEYASRCHTLIDKGEEVLSNVMRPLRLLERYSEGTELLDTLIVYLLDADSGVNYCAEHLFVHKNTIKYRLRRIGVLLGHPVDKEPEKFYLYRAAAIKRLLEKSL